VTVCLLRWSHSAVYCCLFLFVCWCLVFARSNKLNLRIYLNILQITIITFRTSSNIFPHEIHQIIFLTSDVLSWQHTIKVHRCSESMHCECLILVHCDATIEWERNGKVRMPRYSKALWRNRQSNHMRALIAVDTSDAFKTSLRFVIAPFANLGDLDEILQLVSATGIRHFVNRNY